MKELAKNVVLFRKEQTFTDKEGNIKNYMQYYISFHSFNIPIKCVFPNEKILLSKYLSSETFSDFCGGDCDD